MNIDKFAAGFRGAGARPHLFAVRGKVGPSKVGDAAAAGHHDFHIKTSSLPASTLGIIEVPHRGRKIKIPGDRTFAEWSITILCANDFIMRDGFEDWSNTINEHQENTSRSHQAFGSEGVAPDNPHSSKVYHDWSVTQLNRAGLGVKEYNFVGCWPSEVGAVEMDYETTDSVAEFPVTLQYSYWTTEGQHFKHAGHSSQTGVKDSDLGDAAATEGMRS